MPIFFLYYWEFLQCQMYIIRDVEILDTKFNVIRNDVRGEFVNVIAKYDH